MHPLLNIATQAARNAAKIILRNYDRLDRIKVSTKGHKDFVTDVDRLAEEEIIKTIHKSYPDHAIFAEESGETGYNDYCWLIDPIDGTTNFIHGFPQFSISIAMKNRNVTEIALVYDPLRNELFTAAFGRGAHLNERRIRVSMAKQLSESLIGTGFPTRDQSNLKKYLQTFEKFVIESAGVRRAGSCALDLAYVAAGRLDGFFESGLKAWDIAAGALIVQEAGGMVSDYDGKNQFNEKGNVVAANNKIFQSILSMVQE